MFCSHRIDSAGYWGPRRCAQHLDGVPSSGEQRQELGGSREQKNVICSRSSLLWVICWCKKITFFKKTQKKNITVTILYAPLLVSDGRVCLRDRPIFLLLFSTRFSVEVLCAASWASLPRRIYSVGAKHANEKRSASAPNATNDATGPQNRALVQPRY